MTDQARGSALHAVPVGPAADADANRNGLTPPQRKGGSRFISDVLVEMGFLARERVDEAVEQGKASGRAAEQLLLEAGAVTSDRPAGSTQPRSASTKAVT
jgi:hypothetical protein